ncbi:putative transposon, En/Spm-like, transposase-associated domain protein [Tanacetum coccineum]
MDTSWMYLKDRTSSQFTKGVELFLDSIFSYLRPGSFKKCPCDNDQNEEVTINIKRDDIVGMVQDAMGIPNVLESADVDEGMMDDETKKVFKITAWVVITSHARFLWVVLELFFEALKEIGDVVILKSYYEANKIVFDLGFSYETWDACPNDCMLFHGDDKFLDSCSFCEASRYKKFNNDKQDDDDNFIFKRKIPAKQVHYFPLKTRLKRLFMSPHTASQMTWHSKERVDDGLMRHPADSPAWKMFNKKYLKFGCESRNVRLGLASDGCNLFRTMTISHSTWPVVLIPYNLPPWLCMKQPSFILYVLIDGPKAHGDKIDIYFTAKGKIEALEIKNEGWREKGIKSEKERLKDENERKMVKDEHCLFVIDALTEGYIAKGALMEECMTFCARRHLRSLQKLAPRKRQRIHNKEFSSWFKADVRVEYQNDSDEEIKDESEAHISDESEEEFDDTIDDTSDNDGVWNMSFIMAARKKRRTYTFMSEMPRSTRENNDNQEVDTNVFDQVPVQTRVQTMVQTAIEDNQDNHVTS